MPMLDDIGLFKLADKRLAWVDHRQRLLAQNIANADTPGWKPLDLTPFAATLRQASQPIARTDPGHLGPSPEAEATARRKEAERAPDGNAVSLDEQLAHLAQTETAHELAGDLYKKYLGFFRLALGR